MAMVRNGGLFGGSGLQGIGEAPVRVGTEDMKNAYRQIPLPDGQVAISITARAAFGAGHSVPNFHRVAGWIQRTLVRAFRLLLDHFFDDFYYVVTEQEATIATLCLREGFKLLGFQLDSDKSQVPSAVAEVLGVHLHRITCHAENVSCQAQNHQSLQPGEHD